MKTGVCDFVTIGPEPSDAGVAVGRLHCETGHAGRRGTVVHGVGASQGSAVIQAAGGG